MASNEWQTAGTSRGRGGRGGGARGHDRGGRGSSSSNTTGWRDDGHGGRGSGSRGGGGGGGGSEGGSGGSFRGRGGSGRGRDFTRSGAHQSERYRMIVRNLPPDCTSDELRGAFEGFRLADVAIPLNKDTQRTQPFAFVELCDRTSVSLVLTRPKPVIRGRELGVSLTDVGEEAFKRGLPPLRLGIYFGSFDPVHENHAALVDYVLSSKFIPVDGGPQKGKELASLDHVVLVPNPDQPSKPFLSSLPVRSQMLQARFNGNKRVHIFDRVENIFLNQAGRETLLTDISQRISLGIFPTPTAPAHAGDGKEPVAHGAHGEGEVKETTEDEQQAEDEQKAEEEQDGQQDDKAVIAGKADATRPPQVMYAVETFQILGQDSFERQGPGAKNSAQRVSRRFIVLPREGEREIANSDATRDFAIIASGYRDAVKLSSTAVRQFVARQAYGLELESAEVPGVHPTVARIIRQEGLYAPHPRNPAAQVVVILGGPGTGKGTLASRMRDAYGFTPVSTGDFNRMLGVVDPELNAKLEALKARGGSGRALNCVMRCVLDHTFAQTKTTRFVIDGLHPDSLVQNVRTLGGTPDLVVYLHCKQDTMLKRINARVREGDTPETNSERVKKFVSREDDYRMCVQEYEKLMHARVVRIDTDRESVEEYLESSGLLGLLLELQATRPFPPPEKAALEIDYVSVLRECLPRLQFPKEVLDSFAALEKFSEEKVAEHYNGIIRNQDERKESKIRALRNFNNCAKSALIQESSSEVLRAMTSGKASPGASSRDYTSTGGGLDVLDLCCGKGGDLTKLEKVLRSYVGADIAAVSVQENLGRAQIRFRSQCDTLRTAFIATNCCANLIAPIVEAKSKQQQHQQQHQQHQQHQQQQHYYHFVNCQFALHYSFASEDSLRTLLRNAADRLALGGRFLATFPNMEVLLSRLEAARAVKGPETLEFGNEIYNVRFKSSIPSEDAIRQHPEKAFGIEYVFGLEDAIDDCAEFAVHLPTLEHIAGEYGLRCVRRIDSILSLSGSPAFEKSRSLYVRYGGVDPRQDEVEAIGLYQAMEFEQVDKTHPSLQQVASSRDNNVMLTPLRKSDVQSV